ncbi:nitroreductase domain protein [Mycobacterium kansasii]|uniref:Nitroreductase domain protein n=1 Tax=Mycobacterium kansasii TaxID=1768 RepID=A0A1V3XC96_MYCKA|nr:nitroreductase domain protein [Mycobacterium kansasii]
MTAHQEPLTMPLEEAMRTQRAIRRLKSDPVDDSLVLHLLELAMKAPTVPTRRIGSSSSSRIAK